MEEQEEGGKGSKSWPQRKNEAAFERRYKKEKESPGPSREKDLAEIIKALEARPRGSTRGKWKGGGARSFRGDV